MGATPTRAAICFLFRVPDSGTYDSSDKESWFPTPSTNRSGYGTSQAVLLVLQRRIAKYGA